MEPPATAFPPPPSIVEGAIALIGNTPLLRTRKLDTGLCTLFLKLENQNPGGSVKDRVGLAMIEAAELDGRLKPGGTIVEATAGNTGLGLALAGALKGYRVKLVIPDKMSREKILHLRALGAEIINTRSDVARGHPEYYQDMARRIAAETPGAFFADQFSNPANPEVHERTTAAEIVAQMDGRLDAFVAGVGSGGTLTGCARGFRAAGLRVRMIAADPEGSVIAEAVRSGQTAYHGGSWLVEGIGEDFVPDNLDLSLIDEAVTVSDAEAFAAARLLLRTEGILAGGSSGTLLAGALKWCRAQTRPMRVVSLVCDTGNKYLTRTFDPAWLADEGVLLEGETHEPETNEGAGTVAHLLNRRAERGELATVAEADTLATAYRRMRSADVSQLPVVAGARLVGVLDEEDMLAAVDRAGDGFDAQVGAVMVRELETLEASAPLSELRATFARGRVGFVVRDGVFLGILTRIDLLAAISRANATHENKTGDKI